MNLSREVRVLSSPYINGPMANRQLKNNGQKIFRILQS